MGANRSRSGTEICVRTALTNPAGRGLKPPPDQLYGRLRGHKLRPRQALLLDTTLPRLRFPAAVAGDARAAFDPRPSELWVEIGFGGGEHALAMIAEHGRAGLVACEVFESGICSLLSRLVPEGGEADAKLPGNLRIWDEDGRRLLNLLPDRSVNRLFLLFPDPWPKTRHAKRRFVHPATIDEVARVLASGAEWRIATDDPTYQAWVADVLAGQSHFRFAPPGAVRPPGWPPTRYEAKALAAGRRPLYWAVRRL